MNKYFKHLALIGLSAIVISGCGSSNGDSNSKEPASQPASAPEDTKKDTPEETKENKEKNDAGKDEGMIRILEQNIQYNVNGEQKEETAFLKHSDNQNYSLYVLPGYELTAEEPNKDVLFWSEDDSVFMRIELLPADVDWASLEENTKSQLVAVNPEVKETAVPEDPFYQGAWMMETKSGSETVASLLIKTDGQPMKLTIFTKENADHRDAFLEMAKTILKENK